MLRHAVPDFDPTIPSVARVYDYFLGGKDNMMQFIAASRPCTPLHRDEGRHRPGPLHFHPLAQRRQRPANAPGRHPAQPRDGRHHIQAGSGSCSSRRTRLEEHAHEQSSSRIRPIRPAASGGEPPYSRDRQHHRGLVHRRRSPPGPSRCARELRGHGADGIEPGAAASHPDSASVSATQERRRLAPVLEQFAAHGIPVSANSFRPETLRFATSGGAAYLNDIHGFGDLGMYPVLAAAQCRLIVMRDVQTAAPDTLTLLVATTGEASHG